MFDWRWVVMRVCCRGLHRFGRGNGKFVFAIAARPEPKDARVEMAIADTTAIPAGDAVRAIADGIVDAHIDAAMRQFFGDVRIPEAVREAVRDTGADIKQSLPARTWKVDEVGQA